MHLDFYDQYKNYSNVELLKILQQPDAYQPLALEAASRVLEERKHVKKDHPTDLLDLFMLTEEKIKPSKWLIFFLSLIALEYLWRGYKIITSAISLFYCDRCKIDYRLFTLPLLNFLYVPFVFYLLLKRNAWGWGLLCFTTYFSLIRKITQLPLIYRYVGFETSQGIIFIVITLLKLAFVYYLWRKEIRMFFQVGQRAKLWTAFAVICAIGLLLLVSRIMPDSSESVNTF